MKQQFPVHRTFSLRLICNTGCWTSIQEQKPTRSCSAPNALQKRTQTPASEPTRLRKRAAGHDTESRLNPASVCHHTGLHRGACVGVSMCDSVVYNAGPSVRENTSAEHQRTSSHPRELCEGRHENDHNIKSSTLSIWDLWHAFTWGNAV